MGHGELTMERVIATHRMQDDFGNVYAVDEIQEYVDAEDLNGPNWLEGMKRLELEDGSAVNFVDENTFEIVSTGVLIRRT